MTDAAKNIPEKADTNTIAKMIGLDISYLPLVATLPSGTGVSPVTHAQDARATSSKLTET